MKGRDEGLKKKKRRRRTRRTRTEEAEWRKTGEGELWWTKGGKRGRGGESRGGGGNEVT